MAKRRPKLLIPEVIARAARLVLMDCCAQDLPGPVSAPVDEWALEDPGGQPLRKVREIRDQVRFRVRQLVRELEVSDRGAGSPQEI